MQTAPLLLYTHPESGELFSRRWRLFVVDGADRSQSADVVDTPALIGAAPASSLVLSDDTVSRYHAEIDVFAEGLRVRDLDSTNGTFIDGDERIRDGFIENGGTFRVGRTTVRLIAIDEPAASEIETDPHGAPPGAVEHFGNMVGVAAATREVFRFVRKVARSSSAVLLEGETGSGKSLLARRIHDLSARHDQTFVAVDIQSVDPAELNTALFGHAAEAGGGAPTIGLFERANQGSLFLENVDRLPHELQARVRQIIERGELRRDDDKRTRRVDVRVISSTTKPLEGDADFEAGLYRRISVVRLKMPPLRARLDDAAAIVEHLVRSAGKSDVQLGRRTRALLATQRYEHNAKDAAHFASVLMDPGPKRAEGIDGLLLQSHLTDTLEAHRGNVDSAARTLGFDRKRLFRLLGAHDVDLDGF